MIPASGQKVDQKSKRSAKYPKEKCCIEAKLVECLTNNEG